MSRSAVRACLLSAFVPALLGACREQVSPVVCTALFAYVTVAVRNSTGNPVTGLAIADTVRRTGEGFAVPQSLGLAPGSYVVFDDSFLTKIRSSGDSVRVAGSNGTTGFAADFVFDAPDGCHVRKLAGPDTVVAQP